jgi:hypothetical protein
MASGDLNRIEDAFAEAVLDSGLLSRAFNRRRKFSQSSLLPRAGTIPGSLFPGYVAVVGAG